MNTDSMKRLILCCTCFKMDKKAAQAFSLLFPNEVLPDIVKGRDRIYKLAKEIGNSNLIAISKLSGRFAFYVELENDKIMAEYNLITGARIA